MEHPLSLHSSTVLAPLRNNLDFMASPVEDRPGLLIRDPYQYSDVTLIIPPVLVQVLELFDGVSTALDLRQALVRITGELSVGDAGAQLIDSLSQAGFLENEAYLNMRQARHDEFSSAPTRQPAHAGTAYPDEPAELRQFLDGYFSAPDQDPAPFLSNGNLIGLAAPHASPQGAWESYRDAYRLLGPAHHDKIFVVLGTSHYGAPERFGLTRKNFITPTGEARTERSMVDWLAAEAPSSIEMEDYCHATEHSIEFQITFLQHVCGAGVRVLPILCGPYAKSIYEGGAPEQDEAVHRFLSSLGELHAKHKDQLVWVLGVDMAHIGRRYGDSFQAVAHQGEMLAISSRDKDRIQRIAGGDARGFWDMIQDNQDDLKWCGSSPIYTFLRAVPEARAHLLRYQHWQIDPQSVVSFAALAFTA
ncbi:MAG: AmmeMemoRadiSam system protein B [Acidobacteriia bacterium]|nr:AmmeMemoRadiSam system protein B [Terriglobia bacterium]